jgi:lysozyme
MINGSVGIGCKNSPADVAEVQTLLNAAANANISVDGNCGNATIAAIKNFEAAILGMAQPDGVILHGGPTYSALVAHSPPGTAAPSGVQPAYSTPTSLLIDLSANEPDAPPTDFVALRKAGVGGVLLKATEGATYTDPTFPERVVRARNAGLLTAAYHFGTAAPIPDQVNNFVVWVTKAGVDFTATAAALDVEPNPADARNPGQPNTMTIQMADAWVAAFRDRTGAKPFVYGGLNLLGAGTGATTFPNLSACPLWIANYPNGPSFRPGSLPGWQDWTLWQFTDGTEGYYTDSVAGPGCDRNIFRGDTDALSALWANLVAPRQ